MSYLSDNNHLRKYFLNNDKAPSQNLMKEKMSLSLARVYFETMTPKLKEVAGIEPPMKGTKRAWYVRPADLLQGRAVLKPIQRESLAQLSWIGIDNVGLKLCMSQFTKMKEVKDARVYEHNTFWIDKMKQHLQDINQEQERYNTKQIRDIVADFASLYKASITKFEAVLFEAAEKRMTTFRENLLQKVQFKYEILLKNQAILLQNNYESKTIAEKARLKAKFMKEIESISTTTTHQLHDINIEKYVAIEQCRNFLECQKLACQIYVALKERECLQEVEQSQYEHQKISKSLDDEIELKDFEITAAREREIEKEKLIKLWQNKVCHIVENFQKFVTYCLKTIPDQADFFINLEKLILLQLGQAFENPSEESIFEEDVESFYAPVSKPHPFYIFCDKGYKPKNIDQDLCPKHCTSSASQMPVVVINKRCIYSACDNFEQFSDKIKDYIYGQRGEDADFEDYEDYTLNVPVKYADRQQLLELKLESSLMQVLQQEISNIKEVPFVFPCCNDHFCDCSSHSSREPSDIETTKKSSSPLTLCSKDELTRECTLEYDSEPKWKTYSKYIEPKKCDCCKTAKKHLLEHLPIYMRNIFEYDAPELLNFEKCSAITIETLFKSASSESQSESENLTPPQNRPSRTKYIASSNLMF